MYNQFFVCFSLCVLCVLFFNGYNRSQMCGTADSFLSTKRAESGGCERSFAFPPVDGEWFSLFLSSFPLSVGREVVVVRGRSLFHQWMGSDFSLSVCLSLFLFKKKKKSQTKTIARTRKTSKIWRFCLILINSILLNHLCARNTANTTSDTDGNSVTVTQQTSQTMNLQWHSKHHSKLTLNVTGKKKERKKKNAIIKRFIKTKELKNKT